MGGIGPDGGVGGLDLMDNNDSDINGFFKWLFGWLTPTAVGFGTAPLSLRPMGTSKDAALVFPGAKASPPFAEFFFVEYRRHDVGNDPSDFPGDGLVIWHIDARLNADTNDFAMVRSCRV